MLQQFLPLGKLSVEMQPYTVTVRDPSWNPQRNQKSTIYEIRPSIAPAYLQQEMLTGLSAGLSFM